jgi:hypothetical protein
MYACAHIGLSQLFQKNYQLAILFQISIYCISPIIPAYLTYYSLIIPVAIHYKSGIKTVITKPENDDEILFLLINILHRN